MSIYLRLRREAREIYKELDQPMRDLYSTEQCQMCGAHMTIRQLNRVIIQGAPAVCVKCYKSVKGDINKLLPLFEQLSLY